MLALVWAVVVCAAVVSAGVVDQTGTVMSGGPVHRVLPLAPDVTELVFALGGGPLVVAVTTAADFPPAVRALPRLAAGDLEAIIAVRPDLVVATTAGNDPRLIARLRETGVPTFTTDVTSFESLAVAARLLGAALGRASQGRELAETVRRRVAAAAESAAGLPERRALYVVWWNPLIVAAPGTFHDDLLRLAGLANLAPSRAGRYPTADRELLLDPRLEVVVVPDDPDHRGGLAAIASGAAGRRLAAGEVRVLWVPSDPASRPGPRLPDALDALIAARRAGEAARTAHTGGRP